MTMKRGLIFPRSGMGNVYYSQGLPRIYGQLAPNLVGLYDFSERTGGKVYNMAQDNYHGTVVAGASGNTQDQMWSNGSPGGMDFDGVNDYVAFGDLLKTYCDYNKAFTITGWFNPAISNDTCFVAHNPKSNWSGIIFICDGGTSTNHIWFYMTKYGIGNTSQEGNWTYSNQPLQIAATYDGTSNNITGVKLYINGVEPSSYTTTNPGNYGATIYGGTQTVGTRMSSFLGDYYKTGRYNLLAVYNKVLTADELICLYNYEKQFIR